MRGGDLGGVRLPLRGRGAAGRACSRSPSGSRRRAARRSRSATRPGWPTRGRSGEFFAAARRAARRVELTAHFHNTRGQGLANVLAALEQGVDSFESAFGELGGCPVPPGRDREHLHRGPRLDARTRWGSRPASTSSS